jgi:hypothetical protein
MGGSAYYATDFDAGAADLVGRLLADRTATYGAAFVSDHRYSPYALTFQAHPFSAGQAIWLHRSTYAPGPPNYWYAFAGNPDLTPLRAWDTTAPVATLATPAANATDVVPGAELQLQMSEPVSGVSASTVTLNDASGALVAAEVAYDVATGLVTIRPAAPLALSSTYTLSIADTILDLAGRATTASSWRFTTRIDADPLTAPLSIVLESGTHELVRLADDGSVTETRAFDVLDRRWLLADRRARMPGRPGTWLRIADPELGGWWVAESGHAHALGQTEEALLALGTTVVLRRTEHPNLASGAAGPRPSDGGVVSDDVSVAVDRRRVTDGRTFLRLADVRSADAWVEVASGEAPPETAMQRVTEVVSRPAEVILAMDPGERPAFRFDASGRVVDRRMVAPDLAAPFTTRETRVIAGSAFHVLAGGELAGWAVADHGGVRILGSAVVPAFRD